MSAGNLVAAGSGVEPLSALPTGGFPRYFSAFTGGRHDSHHRPHLAERRRDRGKLHPRLGAGRAEREQGFERGPTSLRRPLLALVAARRERPAATARRQETHARGRDRDRGAAPPQPGAEPQGRARTPGRDDPRGGSRAGGAQGDKTHARFQTPAPRQQGKKIEDQEIKVEPVV